MLTKNELRARTKGVGGSDAGAVLNVNPERSKLDVFLDKTCPELNNYEESEPAYWGNILEDIVATEYRVRTGNKLDHGGGTITSVDHPYMLCHLDRIDKVNNTIIECKTASSYVSGEWGDEFTDDIPDSYLIQVQHQMIVTGMRKAHVPVLIGGNDFRIYHVDYDKELAKIIVEVEADFWFNNVVKNVPPEATRLKDVDRLYPQENGQVAISDELSNDAIIRRKEIDIHMKALKAELDDVNMMIKGVMGSSTYLEDYAGRILATWKNQDTRRINIEKFRKDLPELAKTYTKVSRSRFLRIK